MRLTDIAGRLGLTNSSAFRYMWNLHKRGYVSLLHDGSYGSGPVLLRLGKRAGEPWRPLVEATREERVRLRDDVNESVNLGVLHGSRVLLLDVVSSRHSLRSVSEPGTGGYVYSTALGKAIVAFLPKADVEEVIGQADFRKMTDHTIPDAARFRAELEEIRKRGWALDDEESLDGVRCVAVPLFAGKNPIAAMSIESPVARMDDSRVSRVAGILTAAAERLRPVVEGAGAEEAIEASRSRQHSR